MDKFSQQPTPEHEGSIDSRVKNATTIEQLYEILEEMNKLQSETLTHDAPEVKRKIEQVRHGHRMVDFVTRAHGFREAVSRLIPNDPVYKKYSAEKYKGKFG